jgi:hypothetical protein
MSIIHYIEFHLHILNIYSFNYIHNDAFYFYTFFQ